MDDNSKALLKYALETYERKQKEKAETRKVLKDIIDKAAKGKTVVIKLL